MKEKDENSTKKNDKDKENYLEIQERAEKLEALINIGKKIREEEKKMPIPFNDFLYEATKNPQHVFRDIFQLFYDMVHHYVPEVKEKYSRNLKESGFNYYDCNDLFVKDTNSPFFADRLFANRLISLTNSLRKGPHNNQILLFEGPPGSGKSTFLNNLLLKMERYSATQEGSLYEAFWRLDVEKLGGYKILEQKLLGAGKHGLNKEESVIKSATLSQKYLSKRYLEFSCPNHDHPILLIPKMLRKQFLDQLIPDGTFKKKLFRRKENEWIFKDIPCSICTSLYNTLLDTLKDPLEVFGMLYARQIKFDRQFGEGISVFNPGDSLNTLPLTNYTLQDFLGALLEEDIDFTFSYLAKTNNGVLALMDIKEHNVERLMKLHGIISDGVHKVNLSEERIKTLFMGLVNPGDKVHYEKMPSFRDRIISMRIPYVLDYKTEVEIYYNKFGKHIKNKFQPHVLDCFARLIISTRLNVNTPQILDWLQNPKKYAHFLDKDFLLLKMDIYRGELPNFLSDEDVKAFTPDMRQKILAGSQDEGKEGISGRQSLNIFNNFYSKYGSETAITLQQVSSYFKEHNLEFEKTIEVDLLDALETFYDYHIMQEIKESIYYYNEEQIAKDIQNYIYAINFDMGETRKNHYTGDMVEITETYLKSFEILLLGVGADDQERAMFRKETMNEYISFTLAQEIRLNSKRIEDTEQFKKLFRFYTKNLKENALFPYVANENFRRAILDYGKESFNTYDSRLKRDVTLLMTNLKDKFCYNLEGAQKLCIYVIDKKLLKK